MMPRAPQRRLVERRRDNAVDLPSQRQPGRRHQRIVCRLPTAGIDRGNRRFECIIACRREDKKSSPATIPFARSRRPNDLRRHLNSAERCNKSIARCRIARMSHDQRAAPLVNLRPEQCSDNRFRPNTGRIPLSNCQQRLAHQTIPRKNQ